MEIFGSLVMCERQSMVLVSFVSPRQNTQTVSSQGRKTYFDLTVSVVWTHGQLVSLLLSLWLGTEPGGESVQNFLHHSSQETNRLGPRDTHSDPTLFYQALFPRSVTPS